MEKPGCGEHSDHGLNQEDHDDCQQSTSLPFSVDWLADNNAAPPTLCKECYLYFGHSTMLLLGDGQLARYLDTKLLEVRICVDEKDCDSGDCCVTFTQQRLRGLRNAPAEEVAAEMGLVCHDCHRYLQKKVGIARKHRSDPETTRHCSIWEALTTTDDASLCENPRCSHKPKPNHADICKQGGDADTCNRCPHRTETCQEVLGYIHRIEKLDRELRVAHGVERVLREQTGKAVMVDQSVPCTDTRSLLEKLAGGISQLFLGGKRIETRPGRPLCHVPENEDFHCHIAKIHAFAPGDCKCVPMPCSCIECVLEHVRHCVTDYEETVERVRLGITKLRAMPRSAAVNMPTASSSNPTNSGACAMPGVRKAKNLKNFTKAQKEAFNKEN